MSAETEQPTSEPDIDWTASSDDEALSGKDEQPDGENAHIEGDDEPEADGEKAAPEGEGDPETDPDDEPPEFWSAERKALWAKVTDPELRAAIKEHVAEASRATGQKMEESAAKARAAEEAAQAANANQEKAAAWHKQNIPLLQSIVQGRWAGVDWNKLAAEDPAGYVAAKHRQEQEATWLNGLAQQHQEQEKQITSRREKAHQDEREREHGKLAAKFPAQFGTYEAAQKTYGELSGFLKEKGIPADRIGQVYESAIVEIVMDAYNYRQLKTKAKTVTKSAPSAASASQTPKRVVPGASQRSGANPSDEASRQALERLRSGERSGPDMALAFR